MKALLLTPVVALLVQAAIAAPPSFSASVSADQAAAAGLDRLSPAQLAALDSLVEQYKGGELAAARAAAARATAARQAAETEAAQAKAAAVRAEAAQAETQRAAAPKSPGVFARAKALLHPPRAAAESVVESTIVGSFHGWEPRQVFVLASGERLQVSNDDHYFTPPVDNPRVELVRASFGGFWMRFPDLGGVRVRVNLLE